DSFSLPIGELKELQKSLASSEELHIYEGLPHQAFEKSLLKSELKRKDKTFIGSYPFYTPKVKVEDDTKKLLRRILGSQSILRPHSDKLCGGFHPDYAISWHTEDEDYAALICFGCREIKFVTPSKTLHYDLTQKSLDSLKQLLKPFHSKRPLKN
ncbi:hypothetical protein ACFSW8_17775, partial [Rubritalea tangerina]